MRLLHTSDWHVGKKIRGNSRADEHEAVLQEIVDLTVEHEVDAVLVAGDLFETSSPTPESEAIVYRALLGLAEASAHVFVIAGNHDNARRLHAVTPLLSLGHVHMVAEPRKPDDGGVVSVTIGDEPLNVASVPFVSQQRIVRAAELMENASFENAGVYAERLQLVIGALSQGFTADAVNVVLAHAFVHGGASGGGERAAHLVDEYGLSAQAFAATSSYVALGHLHKNQKVPGATAIHYSGSPLQLDFGETQQKKFVNLIDVEPGLPAAVSPIELTEGTPLRTVRGTLDEIRTKANETGDAWLRVVIDEPYRADLAHDVRTALGDRVVDIIVERPTDETAEQPARSARQGRSAPELFAEYLAELQIEDPALNALFNELLETEGLT